MTSPSSQSSAIKAPVVAAQMSAPNAQVRLMQQARASASFDSKDLGTIIYDSKQNLDEAVAAFERVAKALGIDGNFKLPTIYGDLNRQEIFLEGLRAGKITFQDGLKHKHNVFQYITHQYTLANCNPFGLTHMLFIPYLKLVATPEQAAYWLPLSFSGKIIGSYAQTELAHGTHVGGIETTATFDPQTDEFVIHSPTVTSAKYWPGALGFSATHTVVMALLILDGKNLGVHPFMVQIRSLEDFKPMPGIELGDIGLKMAYNETDNGYALFHHVRIPRDHLLSRYASVSREGIYTSVPLRQKFIYGGMLNGRSAISRAAVFQLAQTLTIAARYSVVREQGVSLGTTHRPETAIITYKHQHYRLITMISQCYAALFACKASKVVLEDFQASQKKGDHSMLPRVHVLMCGLKAWNTQTAADGAEEARKLCGGQGYMAMSGLPDIVGALVATCTFEGENWVMWGQVSRYLVKGMNATTTPSDMGYVDNYCPSEKTKCCAKGKELLDLDVLLEIFQHRAARLIHEAHEKLNREVEGGMNRVKAENKLGLDMYVAARAHMEVFILESFIEHVCGGDESTSKPVEDVLHRLVTLFALTTIASPFAPFTSSFIADGYLTQSHIHDMSELIDGLLEKLLPDVIALTDAFCFTDASLRSAIGCKDGDMYNRLMAWTRQLPINKDAKKNGGVFKAGWEQYTKPFLRKNGGLGGIPVAAKL